MPRDLFRGRGGDALRVLIACDWFLKYSVSQAAALRRAGVEVCVLCRSHLLEFDGSRTEREAVLAQLNGAPVHALRGRVSSLSAVPQVLSLRRAVRAWRPDLVHAHDNTDPRLLAIASGFPRVTTVHDPVPHPGHPPLDRANQLVRRRWISGSDAVVVHGESLVDELPDWVPRARVAVLEHGAAVRAQPLTPPERPSVLLFGRLEPYKGIDVLLSAMERVWKARPETRLVVAGRGPEAALVPSHPQIELRAEYIPEAELDRLFGDATVSVLPYVQASGSGAGAYAVARGIPTIVSDVGALRAVALDSSFVVPPGDDRALAESILDHLDHGEELRQAVLAFAQATVSWDACARESLRLYASVLSGDRS